MGFSMHINYVDVICDDSLENTWVNGQVAGYQFKVRLSYYRGHFLSDIDKLEVYVDGEKAPKECVMFGLNGKQFSVSQLSWAMTEFWDLLTSAQISVIRPGGLSEDKEHHIRLVLMLRVPYLPLPGGENDHSYMPLDSCGEKTLCVKSLG